MKLISFSLLLLQHGSVLSRYIANDVVNNYAEVKELLTQFYRRQARKYGSDYDPAAVQALVEADNSDDGTELSVNRKIWSEVFENDIILTLPQAESILIESASGNRRGRRQAQPSPSSFWPDLTISYEFAVQDANFQNLIRSALRHIEENTCIRFKENGRDRDGLRYYRGNGCWSNVGRTGGRQLVSIGYGCDSLGIVAHETLHALGLWHEQSRDDRDKFIRIITDRIIRGTEGNFEKRTAQTSDNMGQPYDLGSVMHYGSKAFTQDWNYDTIQTKDKRFQHTIGQRDGISFKDAKMINLRYCTKICRVKLPCENDGYMDPNNCNKCRCPKGFNGIYCNQLEKAPCGGELIATSQFKTIESGAIYANSNCIWGIKSPAGQKIELIFDSIDFPCVDACTSFIEVKATQSRTATGARLCCNTQSGESFYSDGNDIILILKGNSQLQPGYRGFSARYRYYGNAAYTKEPYPSIAMSTTNIATTTTIYTTTTYEKGGEWGLWGEWASCSVSCGGGQRSRIRGCYGGNRQCPGSSTQTQSCNTQKCYYGAATESTCYGRIVLPCDLMEVVSFGEDTGLYRDVTSDSRTPLSSDQEGNDECGGANNEITRHSLSKREQFGRFSDSGVCEKRFTYQCPTSLLTIHMDHRRARFSSSRSRRACATQS